MIFGIHKILKIQRVSEVEENGVILRHFKRRNYRKISFIVAISK